MKEITKARKDIIQLSKVQRTILNALIHSPFPLRPINLYNLVEMPYFYFTIYRALKRLERKKLVEKIDKRYTITTLGILHLEKRILGLKPFTVGVINNE